MSEKDARVVDTPVEPSRLADALRRLAPDEPLLRKLDEPTTAALLERVQEAADLDEDVTIGLLAKWVTGEAAADARAACVQDAAREEITRLAARGAPRETRRAQKPNETWASQLASREREKANMLQVFDEIDVDGSGFVYKHEVDRVQINGQMLSPPYGLAWAGVKRDMFDGLDAPVPAGAW